MAAKGYILIQEVLAICLLCLLGVSIMLVYSRCLRLQQHNLALQRCLQVAENSLAGEEISEVSVKKRLLGSEQRFLEVEVSDGENRLTLVRMLGAEEAEGLSACRAAL